MDQSIINQSESIQFYWTFQLLHLKQSEFIINTASLVQNKASSIPINLLDQYNRPILHTAFSLHPNIMDLFIEALFYIVVLILALISIILAVILRETPTI